MPNQGYHNFHLFANKICQISTVSKAFRKSAKLSQPIFSLSKFSLITSVTDWLRHGKWNYCLKPNFNVWMRLFFLKKLQTLMYINFLVFSILDNNFNIGNWAIVWKDHLGENNPVENKLLNIYLIGEKKTGFKLDQLKF